MLLCTVSVLPLGLSCVIYQAPHFLRSAGGSLSPLAFHSAEERARFLVVSENSSARLSAFCGNIPVFTSPALYEKEKNTCAGFLFCGTRKVFFFFFWEAGEEAS